MWQEGTFPSLEHYETLKSIIGYLHLKGGRVGDGRTLEWKCGLSEASWPVTEILNQVARDGISPVVCLNPSHGKKNPEYQALPTLESDLAFCQTIFREVAV